MSLDIDALLSELTLEEKASLTSGSSFWYTAPVERLGIPKIMVSDGPHGLRAQPGEGDHVGLGGSLPATCFPTASAVASAWNPDLLRRIGEALAQEARACNLSVILGPGDQHEALAAVRAQLRVLLRRPLPGRRAGRRDRRRHPVARGRHVGQALRGQQPGDRPAAGGRAGRRADPARDLPAGVRADRHGVPAVDDHVLVQQGQRAVRVGEPVAAHARSCARSSGFAGLVVSDWGAVYHRVPALRGRAWTWRCRPTCRAAPGRSWRPSAPGRCRARSSTPASARCSSWWTRAWPCWSWTRQFDADAHHALARAAAAESVVLLKNDGPILPLAADGPDRRDRRVRPDPAVPGRGQLAGQPHPGRERPRRARRDVRARSRSRAGYGIGDTGDDEALRARGRRGGDRRRDGGHADRAARAPTSRRASTAPT